VKSEGLTAQLARFAQALRGEGLRVGVGDELDAATALTLVDLLDRAEVHRALRIAFKVPREAWSAFDRLFERYWAGAPSPRPQANWPRESRGAVQWRWDGERVRVGVPETERETPSGDDPGYSPEALLRKKPFDELSQPEIDAMHRMLARLVPRLATRRSRRLVPTHARGVADLRRSFRRALASDGDFLRLARRARAIDEPHLVLLYDTSGSMDSHARVFLPFAFALRRTMKRAEIFAFNTHLVRVTRAISPAQVERTLARLAGEVPDWSGGTRIGASLAEFVAQYQEALIRPDTTVVIVSDGLDRGDAAVLEDAMRRLRARAGKIVWLNPLLGDPRYRPEAAGMRAALPFVDHFGAAHNLQSLEGLLRLVA
jgi:uncharacterized protein with von Willebrand factor type A (vWA) domain